MRDAIIIAIISGAGLAALGWGATRFRDVLDRRAVYRWLRGNTRDEPGESHVATVALAKGTALPEDRVRRACMADRRIHRGPGNDELWSLWRAEEQSIYEKRGLIDTR